MRGHLLFEVEGDVSSLCAAENFRGAQRGARDHGAVAAIGALSRSLVASDTHAIKTMELRPSDLPSITAANFTKSLSLAGGRGMYIGFSAKSCSWCTREEAWAHYLGNFSNTSLPLLARVDGDRDESLLRKHEIDELPALVLAWSDRYELRRHSHPRGARRLWRGAAHAAGCRTRRQRDALRYN